MGRRRRAMRPSTTRHLWDVIIVSLAITLCHAQQGDPKRCMRPFHENPRSFDICKSTLCFMFLRQRPYVTLPENTSSFTKNLFPCTEYNRVRDLDGVSFKVFERIVNNSIEEDASLSLKDTRCVWAGEECLFGDLVEFLNLNGTDHQFAILGYLLEVSTRMTEQLFPSTSLFDDRMVIIGSVRKDGPLTQLKRPFRDKAWYLFGSMLVIFLIVGIFVVWTFSPDSLSLIKMILHFLGDESGTTDDPHASRNGLPDESGSTVTLSDSEDEQGNRLSGDAQLGIEVNRNRQAMYKAAVLLWRIALSAFLVILLLFYEVAVVNFLFIEQSSPNNVPVNTLNQKKLREYAVLKNSALEDVWSRTVDPYQEFLPFPWRRCKSEDECFNLLTNKSSGVKFAVTYSSMGEFQLRERGKCQELAVRGTEKRLYSFGAGWLFGRQVPDNLKRLIDQMILDLRVTDKMRELVEEYLEPGGGKECSADRGDIEAPIILLPLVVLVGPCLAILAVVLVISWRRRIDAEREEPPLVTGSSDELINVSIQAANQNASASATRAIDLRRRHATVR